MVSQRKALLTFFILLSIIFLHCVSPVLASPTSERIMGDDRYKTAVAISQRGWQYSANTAILTTGENFPDALSAAPLAQKLNAPILLTEPNSLNSDTLAEIKRLNVKKVYIIGGTGVISGDIEKLLSLMGITTIRLAGQDRYETALAVAAEVGVSKGAFVVSGLDFPDAVSVSSIAAVKAMPILLVPSDVLTQSQQDFLSKNKITNVFVVNGNSQISDQVISQFPDSEVISGNDPYERNIKLIMRFADDLDKNTLYVATGRNFPDALAASVLAQKNKNPILLIDDSTVPTSTSAFLATQVVTKMVIIGDRGVISQSTETTLKSLSAEITSLTDITQTIQEKQSYALPKTVTATLTNGQITEVPVSWGLSTVDTSHSGSYSFQGKVNGYSGAVNLILTITTVIAKVDNIAAEIVLGSSYTFPDTVNVRMTDNSVKEYPVTWNSTSIITPNKVGSMTYQGTVEGISQKATLTLKVSENTKITLKDTNLASCIRDLVGKEAQEPLYKKDVLNIVYLDANSKGIQDLTGLDAFINLKFLNLSYNTSLTSVKLAPLVKLTNLQTLLLTSCNISDTSQLKSLTTLEVLDLRYNSIKDFSSLKGLTGLKQLYLKYQTGNDTPDYIPLSQIYNNLTAKDFDLE